MDGNQDEFFHWILTMAMVQCYGLLECAYDGGKVVESVWRGVEDKSEEV